MCHASSHACINMNCFVPNHGIKQCVYTQKAMLLAEGPVDADLNVKPPSPLSAVPFTADSAACMTKPNNAWCVINLVIWCGLYSVLENEGGSLIHASMIKCQA